MGSSPIGSIGKSHSEEWLFFSVVRNSVLIPESTQPLPGSIPSGQNGSEWIFRLFGHVIGKGFENAENGVDSHCTNF